MIQLIDREEIFFKSAMVDHYLSKAQQRNPEHYIEDYRHEGTVSLEDPFDHEKPFHSNTASFDDFAVIGCANNPSNNFTSERSLPFMRFFTQLGISRLYLMDELRLDWMKYPFKTPDNENFLKAMIHQPVYTEAFTLDIEDLETLLPPFTFSERWNCPIVFLFPAEGEIDMAIFLCDDNNFLTSFFAKDSVRIAAAAVAAGLLIGGLEICQL